MIIIGGIFLALIFGFWFGMILWNRRQRRLEAEFADMDAYMERGERKNDDNGKM